MLIVTYGVVSQEWRSGVGSAKLACAPDYWMEPPAPPTLPNSG